MKRLLALALLVLSLCAVTPAYGRIHRSKAAVAAFKRTHPCPANGHTSGSCPGFIVDHVIPLACGGNDDPINMNWQSVADAKAKDKWERIGCK